MQSKVSFALLALALVAVPLSAQGRSSKVPPGQLPPRGMCRVWIDGVPPGQQPPVTTCAVAAANRVANSRVIYGDRESFPGKGNARFNTSNGDVGRACSAWDAVVVDGRLVNVCRDDRVVTDRRGRTIRRQDLDNENDDDKIEKKDKAGKVKVKGLKGGPCRIKVAAGAPPMLLTLCTFPAPSQCTSPAFMRRCDLRTRAWTPASSRQS